jgi:spermidine synthase
LERSDATRQVVVKKLEFLVGLFLVSFSVLVLQIVQTRILSVIAWYYLAFFTISVAMLGMTMGAVWVYLRRDRFLPDQFASDLSTFSLAMAVAIPVSLMLQFSLVVTIVPSLTTVVSWCLLMAAMALPYVFAGVVVSLALTRSPFPVSQVYGVDLLGAALGCVGVVLVLGVMDGPTTQIATGWVTALAAYFFALSASPEERQTLDARSWWRRPLPVLAAMLALGAVNAFTPVGLRPLMVKDKLEDFSWNRFEQWNSYSRIRAGKPIGGVPRLWGASQKWPRNFRTFTVELNIDGAAGTAMFRYDGTRKSIEFLRYDLVNLGYNLPGIRRAAIIGVGGGRDLLSAHLFGVPEIVGVELNPIFIDLLTEHPFYKRFANVTSLPDLQLYVDDARSWFSSTDQKFDLVQMSMIDTWAATGAGAFSLSENGLYTLEGWSVFLNTLNEKGIFTVSRWYNPSDANETGRMIALATAALLRAGVSDVRPHLVVAHTNHMATLVLSKSPFTDPQLKILKDEVQRLGLDMLLTPNQPPQSPLLAGMIASKDIDSLNAVSSHAKLDLSVSTDNRPFFFNQLRFSSIPEMLREVVEGKAIDGVLRGNLIASITLVMILFLSMIAVVLTILLPLRSAAMNSYKPLIAAGSAYFALIGMGFMLAEIALLQYFSVYLGHPTQSLAVCLFSLILATGLGCLTSHRVPLASGLHLLVWGMAVVLYLLGLQQWLTVVFRATAANQLGVRVLVSVTIIMPLGFLLGFAFPTGMKLVEAIDKAPTPWFWGINGAAGVMASVLAVMASVAIGIHFTMLLSGLCYFLLIPVAYSLLRLEGGRPGCASPGD